MINSKTLAVSLLSAAGGVDAFWRMPCRSRTGLGRIDPLMDFGDISDHVHTIHGGGSKYLLSTQLASFTNTTLKTLA